MGPGALRRNGALFRCSRNFWDVADDISAGERLAFASRRRKCSSAIFRTPFHSGIWSGDGRLTLFAQGQFFWSGGVMTTPSFCRSRGSSGVRVAFTLPVHDDAMTMCPEPAAVKSQFAPCQIGHARKQRRFARGFGRGDRRHVDDAARSHRGRQHVRRLGRPDENWPNRQRVGDDASEL